MKVTLIFYPNSSKKNRRSGKIPIYMRVGFNRAKSECRLNAEIAESELLLWDPMTMRMKDRSSPVNLYLSSIENKFHEFHLRYGTDLSSFTAHTIKNHLFEEKQISRNNLIHFVDDYFDKAVVHNVDRRPGTIKNYRRAINHLKTYIKKRKKENMLLPELDFEFAADFKNYLVSSDPVNTKVGMCEVSAATVIKKFRTIFNHAVDQGLLKRNPFKLVKIKSKSPRRERLTIEQVKKIYSVNLDFWPFLPFYKDYFLFTIFTGLAYQDCMNLTWANLEERKDGNIKLSLQRQKSTVLTESFLIRPSIAIVKKYCRKSEGINGRVLPLKSNKEINEQLKKLAQLAEINTRLSTHVMRHTFRQLLAEADITDTGVIRRLMGQTGNGDIDEIYYSVTETRLMDAKNKLEKFIFENGIL